MGWVLKRERVVKYAEEMEEETKELPVSEHSQQYQQSADLFNKTETMRFTCNCLDLPGAPVGGVDTHTLQRRLNSAGSSGSILVGHLSCTGSLRVHRSSVLRNSSAVLCDSVRCLTALFSLSVYLSLPLLSLTSCFAQRCGTRLWFPVLLGNQ